MVEVPGLPKPATATFRLSFWKTIWQSYGTVFGNLDRFIRVSWLWMLVAYIAWLAAHLLSEFLVSISSFPDQFQVTRLWLSAGAIGIPLNAYAVSWHRLLLLNEDRGQLRLGDREYQYMKRGFIPLFIFFSMAPLVLAIFFDEFTPLGKSERHAAVVLVMLIVIALSPFIIGRLGLTLPAAALEEPLGYKESWRITHGNSARLGFGIIVILISFGVIDIVQTFLLNTWATETPLWVLAPISIVVLYLFSACMVSFLSFAYRSLKGYWDGGIRMTTGAA
jgi:hypothetical protein